MKFKGYTEEGLYAVLGDGSRFQVDYRIREEEGPALQAAKNLCVEQTVEFPADHIECRGIQEEVIGRLEAFVPCEGGYLATVSYGTPCATEEFAQFFNVVFGNSSLLPGITVMDIRLPRTMQQWFPGPKYGVDGVRRILGVEDRPLTFTALKPMGLSTEALAEEAYQCALGGVDLIKDDHGLMDQPFSDFKSRVKAVCQAVRRGNREGGGHTMYIPNLSGSVFKLMDRIRYAEDCGAEGIMLAPGLIGFDTMQYAAAHTKLAVAAHPAMAGCFLDKGAGGFDCGLVMGYLPRLCGADLSVFPNYGGRFSLTEGQCRRIVEECQKDRGGMRPVIPCPSGGMTFDRLGSMKKFYGKDTAFLMGGGLFTHGPDLAENCRVFLESMEQVESDTVEER